MNTRLAVLLIALTVPVLSGCGNKGPLVRASEAELTGVPESDAAAAAEATPVEPAATDVAPPAEPVVPPAEPVQPEVPPADPIDDGDDGTG